MKKAYHKIPGVPLNVCTCEQKIAYNAAFNATLHTRETWERMRDHVDGVERSAFIAECVSDAIRTIENCSEYEKIKTRYNVDMIFSALRAGMENYLEGNAIISTYDMIGFTFPALYL